MVKNSLEQKNINSNYIPCQGQHVLPLLAICVPWIAVIQNGLAFETKRSDMEVTSFSVYICDIFQFPGAENEKTELSIFPVAPRSVCGLFIV